MKSKWMTTTVALVLVVGMAVGARAAPTDTGQDVPQMLLAHSGQFGPEMKFTATDQSCAMLLPGGDHLVYEVPIVGPQRPDIAAISAGTHVNANLADRKDGISVPWPQETCDNGNTLCVMNVIGYPGECGQIWRQGGAASSAPTEATAADEFVPITAKSLTIG